jgi:hypothetical protein
MEITQDELLAGFQDLATENAILRRRLTIKDQQIQELTNALNAKRTLDQSPWAAGVLVDQSTGLMHPCADPREQGAWRSSGRPTASPTGKAS